MTLNLRVLTGGRVNWHGRIVNGFIKSDNAGQGREII